VGESTGFDYTRSGNPTRKVLEEALADLEGGSRACVFGSGMAALTTLFLHFSAGDHLVVSQDLYGGTYRVLAQVFDKLGLSASYVDTTDTTAVTAAITPRTRALLVETPGNPLHGGGRPGRPLGELCRTHELLYIVDNTFLTPVLQRPFDFGADVVVHSATKYLGGHNDLCCRSPGGPRNRTGRAPLFSAEFHRGHPAPAGLLAAGALAQNPALRLERHCSNAQKGAEWLKNHPRVTAVYFPGLKDHPGHELSRRQTAASAVCSPSASTIPKPPAGTQAPAADFLCRSLGGVESLMTLPAVQTHGDIPEAERLRLGICESLLRLSVGVESARISSPIWNRRWTKSCPMESIDHRR
jgi:cystathionine gamma-synthase